MRIRQMLLALVASLFFLSLSTNAQEISLYAVDSIAKVGGDCEVIYARAKGLPTERESMFAISEKVQAEMPVKKVRWNGGNEQLWIVAMEQDLDVEKIIAVMNAGYAEYRKKKSESEK